MKDLPKVLTWQLEWDSNLRPSGCKAPNLPLCVVVSMLFGSFCMYLGNTYAYVCMSIFIHSFIMSISIAPLQGDYSGVLLIPAWLRRTVFR